MKHIFATLIFFLSQASLCFSWENHARFTRLSLPIDEKWENVAYESIENVFPVLILDHKTPHSVDELSQLLKIDKDKLNWSPSVPIARVKNQDRALAGEGLVMNALDVLMYATMEPDHGMDQGMKLVEYQGFMGGFEGLSSQGVRHMYFPEFSWMHPFATLHYPFHEMGHAPDRAQLFFDLAVRCKKTGHPFWAYRFLGWGLHYVQDLGQPYHASQFGSIWLLPVWTLVKDGWNAFIAETTRRVSNFHLSFEQYMEFLLDNDLEFKSQSNITNAFQIPEPDSRLKYDFENNANFDVNSGVRQIASVSSIQVIELVSIQDRLMGKKLLDADLNLESGFFDEKGKPKLDFGSLELDKELIEKRRSFYSAMYKAVSNSAIATRWYIEQFRKSN